MTVEEIRRYCRSKKGITEELPFGPSVLVFKVMGKMFALLAWEENPLSISLKCDPERAAALRAYYPAIRGAYHMNKRHWNMIRLDNSLNRDQLEELIDHSYDLVVKKLTRIQKKSIFPELNIP
jgi:predicted DNA-binding protein (MmcQ/YjbR family)